MKTLRTLLFLAIVLTSVNTASAQKKGLAFGINLVVKDYMEIKNALLAGNAGLAQNKAGKLVWDLNSVPDKDMNSQQHAAWFDYLSRLQRTGREISESNSIAYQRKQFSALSNAMFDAMKNLKLNSTTIYRQYSAGTDCYWLSESPAIKNPYYGTAQPKMLKEGINKETLPPSIK